MSRLVAALALVSVACVWSVPSMGPSVVVVGDSTSANGKWMSSVSGYSFSGTRYQGSGTTWLVGTAYSAGDTVLYQSLRYRATAPSTGDTPPASPWEEVWAGTWSAGSYDKAQVVRHDGLLYSCDADATATEPPTGWTVIPIQHEAVAGRYAHWFTDDATSRLLTSVVFSDDAIVMLGVNDVFQIQAGNFTEEETVDDLETIVNLVADNCLLVTPPLHSTDATAWNAQYPAYDHAAHTILRASYVDAVVSRFTGKAGVTIMRADQLSVSLADMVHPDDAGYRTIAAEIERVWK